MRHLKRGRKLNRTAAHRKAMLHNMATSLLLHQRIHTTLAKAKELRGVVDRFITLGKNEDPFHGRRQASRFIQDREALDLLFGEYRERYATRQGGYTRVVHAGRRTGDNAPMAIIELVDSPEAEVLVAPEPEAEETEEAAPAESTQG